MHTTRLLAAVRFISIMRLTGGRRLCVWSVFVLTLSALVGSLLKCDHVRAEESPADTITVFELSEDPQQPFGYRIPSLVVTQAGTLLAFCERRDGLHDHAENDIVLRRSSDGGTTWEPMQIIAEEAGDSLNDPCAVVLKTGRILLRYTRFPKGIHARKTPHTEIAEPGYDGPRNVRVFLMHSDDDGRNWSAPRDVTREMRRREAISLGSPGVGLQLTRGEHAGRIVLPNYEVYHIGNNERANDNSVSYSDDGGETWSLTPPIEDDGPVASGDEAQLAELPDGGLIMTSRIFPEINGRLVSFSHDGGERWTKHRKATGLLTPACMSSILRYSWPGDESGSILLHTLPRTQDSRSNGTLMISRDEGESWQSVKVIVPGDFAYSCLARLPNGDIGCLYETDDYHKISFQRLNPELFLQE
ncbi:MAG: sialidase family protein [Planctomycetaceae bacterium]